MNFCTYGGLRTSLPQIPQDGCMCLLILVCPRILGNTLCSHFINKKTSLFNIHNIKHYAILSPPKTLLLVEFVNGKFFFTQKVAFIYIYVPHLAFFTWFILNLSLYQHIQIYLITLYSFSVVLCMYVPYLFN